MNWDAIGAIAEAFGAIAVIGTLLYLSKQISSSEKTTRIEMRYRYMSDWRDRQRQFADDPEKALLLNRIAQSLSDDEFEEREMQIWRNNVSGQFVGLQTNYDLYKEGILTEEDYEYFVLKSLQGALNDQPRLPLSWSRAKHLFKDDFTFFIDGEIEKWEKEGK